MQNINIKKILADCYHPLPPRKFLIAEGFLNTCHRWIDHIIWTFEIKCYFKNFLKREWEWVIENESFMFPLCTNHLIKTEVHTRMSLKFLRYKSDVFCLQGFHFLILGHLEWMYWQGTCLGDIHPRFWHLSAEEHVLIHSVPGTAHLVPFIVEWYSVVARLFFPFSQRGF